MLFETIFADLDGVFSNFQLEAVRAHLRAGNKIYGGLEHYGTPLELTWDILRPQWPPGMSTQTYCCGIPCVDDFWCERMEPFWRPIRLDPLFWQNMSPFSWNKQLLKILESFAKEIVFVSTPDADTRCDSGKKEWLSQHGLSKYECILLKQKWRICSRNCLLIDDHPPHIKAWQREHVSRYGAEGHAILFPNPWNPLHSLSKNPVAHVRNYLEGT